MDGPVFRPVAVGKCALCRIFMHGQGKRPSPGECGACRNPRGGEAASLARPRIQLHLPRRPALFLLIEVRAGEVRVRVPVPILVMEDLLASFEAWAFLLDRRVGPRVAGVLRDVGEPWARFFGGTSRERGPASPGRGASRWLDRPISSALLAAVGTIRALRGLGAFTFVDVSSDRGDRVLIRLV